MYYDVRTGSLFLSMNHKENQPWRRDLIVGTIDGNWKLHPALSGHFPVGDAIMADTWFAREQENIMVLNGSVTPNNTSQSLLDCIPDILRGFQHPEQPLFWNVGSLDSFFSSQRKNLQQ